MKILLIYPYFLDNRLNFEDISFVPIGVYFVGALLKEKGYDVEILNLYNFGSKSDDIKKILLLKKPGVVGFSVLHANRWGGIKIAEMAKKIDPTVTTVFGGVGTTFLYEHLLTHFKQIDYTVIGEGEYTFLNLIRFVEKKNRNQTGDDSLEKISGIAFRKNNKIIKTKPAEKIQNIDDLPVPAKYFSYQHVTLTRGCPGKCTFCGSPMLWGSKVKFHSADYFLNQLELLYKKGISFFYFSDDTFTLRKDIVIKICKKIIEKKMRITWVSISHVNYINEEVLYWMRKAGCSQISYGIESGSEKIRKLLNKNINTERIKKTFALTVKYSILPRAYFIYGCPEETLNTINETMALINEIKPLSVIFYILDIFPGTSLYQDFIDKKKITDNIWLKQIEDIMYFETDSELSADQILSFGSRLRTFFFENIAGFTEKIELVDKKDLFDKHADFLSRLAMTFSHGEYSKIDTISNKDQITEKLFRKALEFHPDSRAYLGLAIIKQKKGEYFKSIKKLNQGLKYFPDNSNLTMCLGVSYMNIGEYKKALASFLKVRDKKQAQYYISQCHAKLK